MTTDPNAITPNESIAHAPLPTEKTLKFRKNILIQFWRFTSFSLRMLKMIIKERREMKSKRRN